MKIGTRLVGTSEPLFVVAEIGLNHGGSLLEALALVDMAAAAGASAVKLQTLRGDTLVTPACPGPAHVAAASLRDFFRTFELDEEAHARVAEHARSLGLAFMSTPFDEDAVDMLERVGCDAYKIASGDLTHHHLIARAARTGKPLVISTGMSELGEVGEALAVARQSGAREVALLHCVSSYPVPEGSQNLRAIATLAAEFDVPVGLSDHGTAADDLVAAVALGACIFEKHVVLDGRSTAIDAPVSAAGRQLATLIASAARTREALGHGRRTCMPAEAVNRRGSRRSLYATRDLTAGEIVTAGDIIALRPSDGLCASRWRDLEGIAITRAVAAGEPFLPADVRESRQIEGRGGLNAA